MKLPILTHPNDLLRQVAEPVVLIDDEVKALTVNMLETMYASGGIGLAAPQVGVLRRVIVIDLQPQGQGHPYVCVNPEILKTKGDVDSREGCLSVPGKKVVVPRAKSLDVGYLDASGQRRRVRATGLLAACFQHEIDHLNGVLLIDPR